MSERPTIIERRRCWTAGDDIQPALETTEDTVWLSRSCRCTRYTIRGVPARRVDVLIEDADDPDHGWLVEVSDKPGRYDGATRRRIALRCYLPSMQQALTGPPVSLQISGKAKAWVSLLDIDGAVAWEESFDRLRWELDPDGGLERIVGWHLTRWYRHLVDMGCGGLDAAATAQEIEAEHPGWVSMTLAEVNRLVSRYLYRLSRDLGWRKLTARERARLGLHGESCWWHEDVLNAASPVYQQTGAGEFSHRAAAGLRVQALEVS